VWIYSGQGWARWNGRAWRSGRLPAAHSGKILQQEGQLLVFSPTDVWYLGTYVAGNGSTAASFAERYDGSTWRAMPAPGITYFQVGASSPADICAVNGNVGEADGTTTVLACWNGHRWHQLPLPASLDQQNATLAGILVESPDNIWVGGGASPSSVGLAAHWNGSAWRVTDLPAVKSFGVDVLSLLVPDGHGGLWARGVCDCGPAWRLWHYTGGKWVGPAEPVSGDPNFFFGMALVPGTTSTLAVGVTGTAGAIWLNGRKP
jgi:hypothetical protein